MANVSGAWNKLATAAARILRRPLVRRAAGAPLSPRPLGRRSRRDAK